MSRLSWSGIFSTLSLLLTWTLFSSFLVIYYLIDYYCYFCFLYLALIFYLASISASHSYKSLTYSFKSMAFVLIVCCSSKLIHCIFLYIFKFSNIINHYKKDNPITTFESEVLSFLEGHINCYGGSLNRSCFKMSTPFH